LWQNIVMTDEADRLRAKIDAMRLSINRCDAGLTGAMTNRARDALRKRRLDTGEELQRLFAQLQKVHQTGASSAGAGMSRRGGRERVA
jgi:hypothetical protein